MKTVLSLLFVLSLGTLSFAQAVKVDPKLPDYKPVSGIAGQTLKTVGSDTMNNMVGLWTEEFKKMYPGIKPEVDGKGSSNAIPALVSGQATFGPMSREPKKSEIEAFKAKFNYEPVILPTSIDMLAVYVNRKNPIKGLSFQQLDAVFSSTRKGGEKQRLQNWGKGGMPIICYGRNAASGTYGYFKKVVLGDGDYGNWVNEMSGSSNVVSAVAGNEGGIGYSGIGYRTPGVRPLAISTKMGGKLIEPVPENAYSGAYPLSRFLYLSVNFDKRNGLDPVRKEFLKYVFSKQGQQQVVKDGYLPVSADIAKQALASVGIE